jgi:hypothetical protein
MKIIQKIFLSWCLGVLVVSLSSGCFGPPGLNLTPPDAQPRPTPTVAPAGEIKVMMPPAASLDTPAQVQAEIKKGRSWIQTLEAWVETLVARLDELKLERYRFWLWLGTIGGVALAVVAFFLIAYLLKSIAWAWRISTGLGCLAVLCQILLWVIVHQWLVLGGFAVLLVGAVALTAAGKLHDFLTAAAKAKQEAQQIVGAVISGVKDLGAAHGTQDPAVLEVKTAIQDRASEAGVLGPLDLAVQRLDPADR